MGCRPWSLSSSAGLIQVSAGAEGTSEDDSEGSDAGDDAEGMARIVGMPVKSLSRGYSRVVPQSDLLFDLEEEHAVSDWADSPEMKVRQVTILSLFQSGKALPTRKFWSHSALVCCVTVVANHWKVEGLVKSFSGLGMCTVQAFVLDGSWFYVCSCKSNIFESFKHFHCWGLFPANCQN